MKLLVIFLLALSQIVHADELKLMTWNVYMLPYPIKASQQGPRRKIIAEKLKDSDRDVILFQEAFTGTFKRHLKKTLSDVYPYQYTMGRKHFFFIGMNSGLTVISRYPFKLLGKEYYKDCEGPDCYSSKGIFLIEVTLPSGRKVQIANTHFQAGGDEKKADVRWKQVDLVKHLLDAHKTQGVPQILAGDLNIDSAKGEHFPSLLAALDIQDIPKEARDSLKQDAGAFSVMKHDQAPQTSEAFFTGGFSIPCYKTMPENLKLIDHFLVRPNDSGVNFSDDKIIPQKGMIKGKECDLSDHHPRELTITLN